MARLGFLALSLLLQGMHLSLSEICYSRVCEFDMVIAARESLTYKPDYMGPAPGYFDVELDGRDLRVVNSSFRVDEVFSSAIGQVVSDPLEVITLDGVKRFVITINGEFPGPTLEVTEGAEVVVHVQNMLSEEGVTIHWHGLTHRTNVWMDGVPQITQCAIPSGHTFTYRFLASPAGTFWYHSHVGYQRFDGLTGLLLIHRAAPTLPYFPVMVGDWYHQEGRDFYFSQPLGTPPVPGSGNLFNWFSRGHTLFMPDGSDVNIFRYNSGLINGRGRFNKEEQWPLTVFEVNQNQAYLFRMANSAGAYPMEVSIDSHQLTVVAVDGNEVQPEVFDSVILFSGERVDFKVLADQPVDRYWMRSRVPNDPEQDGYILETLAIVRYASASTDDPTSNMRACTDSNPCRTFNCPLKYFPASFNKECVHISDMRKVFTAHERKEYGLEKVEADEEYFININFFKGVNFNGTNFVGPTTPLYQTDSRVVDCDDCPSDDICACTYRLFLPFNKTIQIVFMHFVLAGGPAISTHPVHIHGHHFAVVRQGFADYNYGDPVFTTASTPNPDIVCNDIPCKHPHWAGGVAPELNLHDPPIKDTVVVPASGYTVVRFRSDNPGPWLVHCHQQDHHVDGPLRLLLIVAEDRFPPPPPFMPTCTGNFTLTDQQFRDYQYTASQNLREGSGFQRVSPNYHIPPPTWTPPPPHPSSPRYPYPPPPNRPEGIILGMGGIIGVFAAGLLGGVLLAIASYAIFSCCFRQQRRVPQVNMMGASPPAYIGGGIAASYTSPVYTSNAGFLRKLY